MNDLVIGILAHVDAGKTTLSEAMLCESGMIRQAGRVDNGNAFLDTYELEKKRGITIFSKQAIMQLGDRKITLLDTPGHVDFSAEMERTLQVLDYAILLVSGADGVQGHTRTLWTLLEKYDVPTFLFFNKMDQDGTDKEMLLEQCKEKLSPNVVDFTDQYSEEFQENVAVCEESLLERVLEGERIEKEEIVELIAERKIFPSFFGAALHMDGVEGLLSGIAEYTAERLYEDAFGAKVFKISRDEQGNRLTFCKITGGSLQVKTQISYALLQDGVSGEKGTILQEKVNQIRIYSGAKYEAVSEVKAGCICALTGLSETRPGQGLGEESSDYVAMLEPVMTYQVILPEDVDAAVMLPKMRVLEEEEPALHVVWDERLQEIRVQIMGEVQLEVLKTLIAERFGVEVSFGCGNIVYKETIANIVEGIGHFEPLRHYAEVHLLLEPLENGSGIQVAADCSEDILDRNWQRLVLTHIEEKEHRGVLTGSVITDMKITLVSGKAHLKHTEGGDFRQATYRAIRQGLMQAQSVLLEPFYAFTLELPEQMIGRAMTDVERMNGSFEAPMIENGIAVLKGRAPVACMQSYQSDVTAYSKGHGRLTCIVEGYGPCHNTEEVLAKKNYDPELDNRNPSASVFCAHGAGVIVPWYEVTEHMHLESVLTGAKSDYVKQMMGELSLADEMGGSKTTVQQNAPVRVEKAWVGTEEIDSILQKTFYANSQRSVGKRKWSYSKAEKTRSYGASKAGSYRVNGSDSSQIYGAPVGNMHSHKKTGEKAKEYLLVDGYNIIFAWQDLNELAAVNVDGARGKLMDILCNYQGIRHCELIVVFDAYRVKGHATEVLDYHNIHVVYTKEAETADQYIEKFAHENGRKYDVTVATSDGLEQIIIRGQGCRLWSAREFEKEVANASKTLRSDYLEKQKSGKNYMLDAVDEKTKSDISEYLENYEE